MSIAGVNKRQWRSIVGVIRAFIFNVMSWPVSIVAALTVFAGAGSLFVAADVRGILGALLAIVTILIAFFDWRSFVIPDWLNGAGFLLGLVDAAILAPGAIVWAAEAAIVRALVAAAIFLALRLLYAALRGRQGLGLGDVKLAAVAGVWLDWSMLPVAIELAVLTALCTYILRQLLTGRRLKAQSKIPFGFFFAPAIWICWFFQNVLR